MTDLTMREFDAMCLPKVSQRGGSDCLHRLRFRGGCGKSDGFCSVPTGQALSFHGMKWKTICIWNTRWKIRKKKAIQPNLRRPERRSILCRKQKSIRPRADGSFPAGGKGAGRNLYEDIRQSGAEARRFWAADTSGHLVIRHRGSQICKNQTARRSRREEYLLVDGYNIIFAWDDLNELAKYNIDDDEYQWWNSVKTD